MPKITNLHEIDINLQRFLDACSPNELRELDLLLCAPRYRRIIEADHEVIEPDPESRALPDRQRCRYCENFVDPGSGYDLCPDHYNRIEQLN